MKNRLDQNLIFFINQLPLNLITSRSLPVIQNLENLTRWPNNELEFLFNNCQKEDIFYKLR